MLQTNWFNRKDSPPQPERRLGDLSKLLFPKLNTTFELCSGGIAAGSSYSNVIYHQALFPFTNHHYTRCSPLSTTALTTILTTYSPLLSINQPSINHQFTTMNHYWPSINHWCPTIHKSLVRIPTGPPVTVPVPGHLSWISGCPAALGRMAQRCTRIEVTVGS